ncbi:uncharacterized protein MKK02DRAFT_21008 [Dioszegia hungarica]|uniref:Protein kinase domain-containing protein n=1 Tax=Dioszegia hungarica TaxID=4972 RepID=A0AA38H2S8_9TREE|nr:uncharacterized protein MKK02DRAFT_21008 [Dioszegia hungarica]KAI9631924.1 hypothetical protein MKK02DRAFT_21008 [Dioszegia hungarica]
MTNPPLLPTSPSSSLEPRENPLSSPSAQIASDSHEEVLNSPEREKRDTDENDAGPSHHRQPSIPPPANARRHRGGVLMSQARSRASSGGFRGGNGVVGSKSFGDLSLGLTMSSAEGEDRDELEPMQGKDFRRITSDGYRRASAEAEENMWDNSARFYHHLHSTSRAGSRQTSPDRALSNSLHSTPGRELSPTRTSSTSASPIHIRRSQTLPQNGPGPPISIPSHSSQQPSAALSPAHAFLQSHLPPLFPSPGSSPEHPGGHSMVILTPTTAEWKELKKEMGEELDENVSSDSSDGRRSSLLSSASSEDVKQVGLMLDRGPIPTIQRPSLHSTVSADYLQREQTHTPDPGAVSPPEQPPAYLTPSRPTFQTNIIAPSPTVAESTSVLPDQPESADPDEAIVFTDRSPSPNEDSPVRFASIGRRESLRSVPRLQEPKAAKAKTKRELERERLFRDLDEELEADKGSGKSFESVQQIGSGLKLSESGRIVPIPLESAGLSGVGSASASGLSSFESASVGLLQLDSAPGSTGSGASLSPTGRSSGSTLSGSVSSISISPTVPFKRSPLHGSPLLAQPSLVSPEESPELESAQGSDDHAKPRLSLSHTANLETIRDYARSLADAKEPSLEKSNPMDEPSKPKSRRPTHRRRDTKRVSLVAGRIVQPFTVPPDTSLPPGHSYHNMNTLIDGSMSPLAKKASLNSFSPFRSPGLTPSTSIDHGIGVGNKHGLSSFPGFNRMDSTISVAPSIGPPSEPGTPSSETAGGVGGRGIEDYVILSEAGKGAYGLVMRAKVKGANGEPEGEEVIIKYIVKVRILADCWKKHKVLGPIPVEIHVMDQLRHLLYNAPAKPHPWDPSRARPAPIHTGDGTITPPDGVKRPSLALLQHARISARLVDRSYSSNMFSSNAQRIASELRSSPARGHPNICKLLDFFEDREFYYMVMPRFGSGLDLFDRVEASPNGLPAFDVRSLIGQLADAVRFLHSNGIVHRDIKDENVILDGHGQCQLIDFGSSAHWRPGKRWDTFSGTLHYASPEILRGDYYGGKEQDVYALGTVAYVLLVGETPFAELPDEVLVGLVEGSRGLEALQERCDRKGQEPAGDGDGGDGKREEAGEGEEGDGGGRLEDAEDLVRRCLELEVGDRPTADVLCGHRFLKGREGWVGHRGWIKTK